MEDKVIKNQIFEFKELYYYKVDKNFRKQKVFFDEAYEQKVMKEKEASMKSEHRTVMNNILTTDDMKRRFLSPLVYDLQESQAVLKEMEYNMSREDLSLACQCIYDSRGGEPIIQYPLEAVVNACMIIKMYVLKFSTSVQTIEAGYIKEQLDEYDEELSDVYIKGLNKLEEGRTLFLENREAIRQIVSRTIEPEFTKMVIGTNSYLQEQMSIYHEIQEQEYSEIDNLVLECVIENRKNDISFLRSLKGMSKQVDKKVDFFLYEIKKEENECLMTCEHGYEDCLDCVPYDIGIKQYGNEIDYIHFTMFAKLQETRFKNMIGNGFPRDLIRYCMEKVMPGLRRYCILYRMDDDKYCMQCKCMYDKKEHVRRRMAISSLGLLRSVMMSNDAERLRDILNYKQRIRKMDLKSAYFVEMMMRQSPVYDNGCDLYAYNIVGVFCYCKREITYWQHEINLGEVVINDFHVEEPRFAQRLKDYIKIICVKGDKLLSFE